MNLLTNLVLSNKFVIFPLFFFSSMSRLTNATLRLINMRASNERKIKQKWNLCLSLRQMRINSDLSDSIEGSISREGNIIGKNFNGRSLIK